MLLERRGEEKEGQQMKMASLLSGLSNKRIPLPKKNLVREQALKSTKKIRLLLKKRDFDI